MTPMLRAWEARAAKAGREDGGRKDHLRNQGGRSLLEGGREQKLVIKFSC